MLIAVIGYVVASFFSIVVRNAFSGNGLGSALVVSALTQVIVWAVTGAFQIGLYRAALAITAGQQVDFASMFSSENMGPYIATLILYSVGVAVGTLLCVLPGIAFLFFGFLAPFYVLDQQLSPVDAIKASFRTVSSNVGGMLGFAIVTLLVYLAGLLACLVGILVTAPVALLAIAYTYRTANGQPVAA